MAYWLLYPLRDLWIGFNVFRYITFRVGVAMATAFFLSLILGPPVIRWLAGLKIRQTIRDEGPAHHQVKAGTPTMGGILINLALMFSVILWMDIRNPYTWITVVCIIYL